MVAANHRALEIQRPPVLARGVPLTTEIALPVWMVLLLVALAVWALVDRLLTPSLRWVLRKRAERALEEFDRRLRIRIQPFKLTKRRVVIDRLLFDSHVVQAAEAFAGESGEPRRLVMAKVEAYAREIVPAFNALIYFRLGYWLARRVSRALYRVRLGSSDREALSRIADDATVVFVINHRSNMDYVLLGHLVSEESALSYAVGEWARIWPLEQLVRAMGAYFVRRRSKNALYRKVLERYVQMATAQGVTQAVFPEGRLSRDGTLQPPKLGLLDYMLRDFDPRGARDIVFVPVAVNYDRVLEDRTLLLDLVPGQQSKGSLAAAWTAAAFLAHQVSLMARQKWHRFGYACANFGTPVSAREYLDSRGLDLRALERSERFSRVGEMASHLMSKIGDLVPVLPVALVSSVLGRDPERRYSELELKAAVQQLMLYLESSGARVYIPRRDREYAIEVGLRMLVLRRLVRRGTDGLLEACRDESRLLRYYANSIEHLLPARGEGPSRDREAISPADRDVPSSRR